MKQTLNSTSSITWRATSKSEPTIAAMAAKYGNAVGSSTAVIVAPSIALDCARSAVLGLGLAAAEPVAIAPQERRRGQHRHAGHDLEHVAQVPAGVGDQGQQQLAGPERDDQTADQVDDEHRQRELEHLARGLLAGRQVQRRRDRGRVHANRRSRSRSRGRSAGACRDCSPRRQIVLLRASAAAWRRSGHGGAESAAATGRG